MERTDTDEAVAVLVSFKLRRIIIEIINLMMLIMSSSPAQETKSFESRHQDIFLEKQSDAVHCKI